MDNSDMEQSGVGFSLSFGLVIERLTPLSVKQVADELDVAGLCPGFVSPTRL
jgi:hypothetical protein